MTSRTPVKIELKPLVPSRFALDGGGMFGVVPRTLWSKHHKPDEDGRIDMVCRLLVAMFYYPGSLKPEKTVVLDSGTGISWNDKEKSIYKLDKSNKSLKTALKDIGIDPLSVTDTVISHLHFDHVAGYVENGEIMLPNAKHHVQKSGWEWANTPSLRDRASFYQERFLPLKENGLLNIVDGNVTLFEGLDILNFSGHTPGMQVALLAGKTGKVAYCTDLMPTFSHTRAAWIMSYDLYPMQSLKEKMQFLDMARADNITLFFEHDPVLEAAKVEKDGTRFICKPCKCPLSL